MSEFERNMHAAMRGAHRRSTSLSILDGAAWLGLISGTIFWANFFFTLLAPESLPAAVQVVVMSIGYAIVLPMLLSMLVPGTAAGMLLQSTRYKTVGFIVTIAAALFMSAHAGQVLWSWWLAQPAVAATQQDRWLAIGSFIVYIVVPALAWVQAAPDRWIAEVESAQHVRRYKAAREANMMFAKEQYLHALTIIRRGLANATAAECDEVAGTLIMFQRAENEAIGQLAGSLEVITGIGTGFSVLDDQNMIDAYDGLRGRLQKMIAPINEADYVEQPPRPAASAKAPAASAALAVTLPQSRGAHQDAAAAQAAMAAAAAEVLAAEELPPRPAAGRGGARRYAAELEAVEQRGEMFTAKSLAVLINRSERTARDVIKAWVDDGLVARAESGSYYIIEKGQPT